MRAVVLLACAVLPACSALDGTGACADDIDRAIGRYGTPVARGASEVSGNRVDVLRWDEPALTLSFAAGRDVVGCGSPL